MYNFTLTVKPDHQRLPANKDQFYLCHRCYAAYFGKRLLNRACIYCKNTPLTFAITTPKKPDVPSHFMICDQCNHIITGRHSRARHHAHCDCRTVHPFPKEPH